MRKKKLQRLFAIIAATTVLTTNFGGVLKVSATEVDLAKEYEIYPIPQNIEYENSTFEVGTEVNIVYESGVDIYTRNRVEEILNSKNISYTISDNVVDGKTDILIGINESGEFVDEYFNTNVSHDEGFFNKTDSHLVSVNDGIIGVLGTDTDSAFYGVTTLKHVFNQLEDGTISEFRVDDYSDVAQRGFIEGYYGNPWSNEDRAQLMKFGGDYKMNQYIFAPKDDPYHNSKWRELYPEEDLEGIKQLAKVGNETKNRYVYALHPFMSNAIRFNSEENYQADLDIIKAKFSQLLEADVRQFAILADDAGVPAQGATSYVKLLSDLTEWLREQQEIYPDLKDEIVFCPNDYMGNGSSAQLKEVNKAGDNVSIISTGGRIWGEVSEAFGRNYKNNIASEGYEGRAPFYWINWPCSDNSKQHLIMGGNDTFLKPGVDPSTIKGIVLNPMQQAEANKSALFANASYAWNIWEDKAEADQNWEDSFKYMDHGTAEETATSTALRELSKHMINQNMDSRVTKLEESVELAPKLNAFKEKYANGESVKVEAEELIAEFDKLREAAILYKNEGNERVVSQITYWLSCWEDTMDAAISYLEAIIAVEDGASNDVIWTKYSNGQTSFEKSKTYGFHYVDHTEYAEVGVQHIVPFIKNMAQNLSEIVSSIVDPSKVITTVITNRTDNPTGSLENLLDNNSATEVVYKTPNTVVAGTYVGVKYNKKVKVKDIHIEMGAASNPRDTMQEAKLQYTEDGKEWIDLNDELYSMPNQITVEGLDLDVMGIRVIATQDRTNTWLGIKDITINKNDLNQGGGDNSEINATLMRTEGWSIYSGSEANLTDGNDSTSIWYKTHTNDITRVGDYIGLDLGEVTNVGNVHFVVGAGDADKWTDYKLEYSIDNENWTTFKEYSSTATKDVIDEDFGGIQARYVRITNLKQLNKWVKFSELRVERSINLPSSNNVYSNVDVGVKSIYVNESLTKLVPQENITLNKGDYIGIKLNRIKDLNDIDLEVSNMDGLTLQTSMNTIEWSDVLGNESLEDARYVRLIANKEVNFNLNKFEVSSNEVYEPSLISAYTDSNTGAEKAFDGNFNTSVKFNAAPQTGSTIVYDLGQTIDVNNLKYVVLDTEKDHIRDGKIQLSLDGETWTDVISIENNIPDTSVDMDSKPTDNGYTHGSVSGGIIPISHAYMDSGEINQEARYLRVVFTAPYSYRWTVINEFLINNGEYIPTVNNPTFVSDPVEVKGFEPSNIIDGDLTRAYKPNTNNGEITSGSFTYRLSDKTDVKKINIIQSGNEISNAKVMARVGKDESGNDIWRQLGTLDKSLNEIVNTKYDNIFEIKIEWNGVAPTIYELITINDYEVPNVSDLEELIDSCNYVQEDYTVNSWTIYSEALKDAKKLLNNIGSATQEAIDNAREALVNAITSLVNISGLSDVISEADEKINGEVSYTEESLNVLKEAVNTAKEVLANDAATLEEVNSATEEVRSAIDNLVEKEEENNPVFNAHLQVAVEEAKKVTDEELSKVVPAVVEEFKAALAEAEGILGDKNATQASIDESFDRLSKAMQMLSFEKGNKENLISLVERISGLTGDDYITSTWDKLMVVLAEANGIISDANAMEEEVSESYNKLLRAFLELRLKPSKDRLEDLINKAKSLDSSKYTVASFRVVEKALNAANEVFENEDASEDEIVKATDRLRTAIDGLMLNSGSVNNGGNNNTNSGNNSNSGNNNSNSISGSASNNYQSSNSNKLPQTGGRSAAAVGIFGTIIATIGAAIVRRKK